jgi:hypothetical protein
MAIDVSYRDTYTTSAEDLARTNKNFIINEGVAFDGLKVTQSLTPGMSVLVAPGTAYFYGSGTNANVMYEFYSDANETVTIGTAGVSARIDIICLKVDASTGVASIVAVAGTPSGSPAVPATPASHYKLAEVAVGAGVTTITNANITSTRRSVFVLPTGDRTSGLLGGRIQVTVASNNLTVAVKTLAGADPSTSSPVGIWIGDTLRWITGALSIAANAGTNRLNMGSAELATREVDLFVYAGYNATDGITLGFSRIPYARLYSDFNTSPTNERHCAISTITNAAAGDNYVNIGRFAATLSASPSFNWSVPSFTNANLIQEPIYETRRLLTTNYQYWIKGNILHLSRVTANITIGATAGASAVLAITYPFTFSQMPSNSAVVVEEGYGYFCSIYFLNRTTSGGDILVLRDATQGGAPGGNGAVQVNLIAIGQI